LFVEVEYYNYNKSLVGTWAYFSRKKRV